MRVGNAVVCSSRVRFQGNDAVAPLAVVYFGQPVQFKLDTERPQVKTIEVDRVSGYRDSVVAAVIFRFCQVIAYLLQFIGDEP